MPRRVALLLVLLCGCDDHLIGDCVDPDELAYEPTWTGVQDLIARDCAACHGPAGVSFDVEQAIEDELADDLTENDYYVVPGDPAGSRLWQSLSWIGDAPPMPNGAAGPLAACRIDHVKQWIASGAPLTP